MKVNVCYIYWTLLFVSFVSSCLLFILVATETGVTDSPLTTLGNETFNNDFLSEDRKNLGSNKEHSHIGLNKNKKEETPGNFGQNQQKQENVAEILSSFEDVILSSSADSSQLSDASLYIIPPEPVSDASNELSETGQAVVFTLVDTASAELQNRASPPSKPHTEEILRGTKNENLSVISTSDETQIGRPPVAVEDEMVQNKKETSKNLSILEDIIEEEIFQEKSQQYVVRAEPKVVEIKADVHLEKKVDVLEETDRIEVPEVAEVINASVKEAEVIKNGLKASSTEGSEQAAGPEDIPSFSEWAQKQLAEAEKKTVQNATTPPTGAPSRASGNMKLRSKNYASPDCGAKIVGTNPEAMYAGSIISPSRDEYVLNACTNRFWFVVELCEAIQAKKIELANFELFSSSPRDFSVSLSDRFPSRDWRSVGHFTAQDERDIQSFNLNPHLFGKFIKVELHSHYGSEHYCPVSLFRVYGTSEFEVLETEVEVHESVPSIADEDDDEEPLDVDTGEPPKTLFGSAQDAVMSIVKKAARALVKGDDSQNDTVTDIDESVSQADDTEGENCVSPSHIVVCDNCSEAMFNQVFDLMSCRGTYLQSLIDTPFVRNGFQNSKLCVEYGLDFSNHRTGAPYPLRPMTNGFDPMHSDQSSYLSALLPPQYIAALCNILAILEKKVVFNISYEINGTTPINLTGSIDGKTPNVESNFDHLVVTPASTCTVDSSSTSQHCSSPSVSDNSRVAGFSTSSLPVDSSATETTVASQIKPTKTLVKEPDKVEGFPSSAPIRTSCDQEKETIVLSETSVQDLPVTVSSSVTLSVDSAEENEAGTTETAEKNKGNKVTVSSSEFVEVDPTEDLSSFPSDSDQQQTGGSEKQSDVMFDERYQESQDSLSSLDSFLLSELKDLDMAIDVSSSSSNPPVTTTTTVAPPSLSQTQQVQKESVFVRLSNRIKALERNMSLSGQYLEELSRRYKKQVEEMQRAFNRTLAAVREESLKGEEREQKRVEEMAALHKQLATLTNAVELLLSERDSWQNKAAVIVQHVILIVVQVVVFGLILYFCRRLPEETEAESSQRKWSFGWRVDKKSANNKVLKRRRSVDGVSSHEPPKARNRRPSEEALNISGTYNDLLITESHTTEIDGGTGTVPKLENKRRRRKKKDGLHKSSSSANLNSRSGGRRSSEYAPPSLTTGNNESTVPTRRASSSELGKCWNFSNGVPSEENVDLAQQPESNHPVVRHSDIETLHEDQVIGTLHEDQVIQSVVLPNDSSPVSSASNIVEQRESPPRKDKVDVSQGTAQQETRVNGRNKDKSVENAPSVRQGNGTVKSSGINPIKVQRLSSPFFMRTAMSSRSNRVVNNVEPGSQARLKSDNWEWYSSRRSAVSSLDKSSPGTLSPDLSPITLHNGSGHSANGQSEAEELDRTSEVGETLSLGVSQKDNNMKKASSGSGLKKMVKKFF